jgi:hypothetical protein
MKKFLFSAILCLWICFFVLGQLGRVNLTEFFNLGFSVAIYQYEILMIIHLILVTIFYPEFWQNLGKKLFLSSFNFKKNFLINFIRLILIEIILSWILAIFKDQASIIALFYFLRFACYICFFLSFFFLRKKLFQKKEDKIINFIINNFLFFILLGFLFFGFYQIITFPDSRIFFALGFDNHYYRLIGTLFDPNLISLIFIVGFFTTISKKKIFQSNYLIWYYLIILLFFIGLILTFSRSGLLAFLGSVFYFLIKKDKKKAKLIYLGVSVLLVISFVFQRFGGEGVNLLRTSTIKIRLVDNFALLKRFSFEEYLFGRGFFLPFFANSHDNFFVYYRNNFGDNLILLWLSYGGLLALSTFLCFSLKIFLSLKNKPAKQATLIAYFIHAQFVNSFFCPFLFLIFLLSVFDIE